MHMSHPIDADDSLELHASQTPVKVPFPRIARSEAQAFNGSGNDIASIVEKDEVFITHFPTRSLLDTVIISALQILRDHPIPRHVRAPFCEHFVTR
jgi:hypothetical protein